MLYIMCVRFTLSSSTFAPSFSPFSNCFITHYDYECNIRSDGITPQSSQNGYKFCSLTYYRRILLAELQTFPMRHFFLTRSRHVLQLESEIRILE